MAKVKPHRASPSLDMTPMVDLAFLLVTFFMLTSTFKAPEPLEVDMPSSVSEIKIPEKNLMLISISPEGHIFFSLDGHSYRKELLNKIGERYNIKFTPEEQAEFAGMGSFGVPVASLKQLLDLSEDERNAFQKEGKGIPADSAHNELADWILYSRMTNPVARIAIKGDRNAPYPAVKKVIGTIQDRNLNRFNLITNLEEGKK